MTSKVIKGKIMPFFYLFSSNNSSVKPALPLMLPQIVCAFLSPILTKREGDGSLFSLFYVVCHFELMHNILIYPEERIVTILFLRT
jgi:hypothetical protein